MNTQDKIIQTIVMRSKFPDKDGKERKLRNGKYIAQGSHASIAFLSNKVKNSLALTEEENHWIENSFTKICLYVNDEKELLDIYEKAKEAELTVHLIQDSGLTEFNNESTYTCLAIGPHFKSKIDPITENLSLF